jgi:hypothetical protein
LDEGGTGDKTEKVDGVVVMMAVKWGLMMQMRYMTKIRKKG